MALARTYILVGRPSAEEALVTAIDGAYIYLRSQLAKEDAVLEFDIDDYAAQFMNLLPRGPAWDNVDAGLFRELTYGIVSEYARISDKMCVLENETFPLNTTQLLAEWERVLGLPDNANDLVRAGGGGGGEDPPEQPEYWPVAEPAYLSAIPGVAAPGFDTEHGTGRTGQSTTLIFVDDLADVNTGGPAPPSWGPVGRTFVGSEEWAIRHSASPKIFAYLTSGTRIARKSIPLQTGTPPRPGKVWIAGQTAPYPGLLRRGTKLVFNGASNVLAQHVRVAMGDDSTGLGADNRKCIESGYSGGTTDRVVIDHCEVQWWVDEGMTLYYKHTNTSICYSVFVNGLHDSTIDHPGDPPDEDHGFAVMMGGGAACDNVGFFGNLIVNATSRSPFLSAEHAVVANNFIYNPGRPYIGPGEAIILSGQGGVAPHYTNVLWNVSMRGPENNASLVGAQVHLNISGSQAYLEGNSAPGWALASQAAFISGEPVGFLQGSTIGSAMPDDFEVLEWMADPHNPTRQEVDDIITIFEATVGAQPGWRNETISRVPMAIDAMRRTNAGEILDPQFVDSVDDDDGWPVVPVTVINPLSPGRHWHSPIPVGNDRDDIVSGGATWGDEPWVPPSFRGNALQLAGRTNLERWLIRQHWYVMSPLNHPDYVPPIPPSEGGNVAPLRSERSMGERRAAVASKIATSVEPTPRFFVSLAADFGFSIDVVEYFPARAGTARVGDRINGSGNEFTWSVVIPGNYIQSRRAIVGDTLVGNPIATWGDGSLESLLRQYKPAHTTLLFEYD